MNGGFKMKDAKPITLEIQNGVVTIELPGGQVFGDKDSNAWRMIAYAIETNKAIKVVTD